MNQAAPQLADHPGSYLVGLYFDLYSDRPQDWRREADFNHSMGPQLLEVMLEYPGSCADMTPAKAAELAAVLGDVSVTVHGPTLNLSLVAMADRIVDATQQELLAALSVCDRIGASSMTIHGGEYPFLTELNGRTPGGTFSAGVAPVLAKAAELGIRVAVENLKGKRIFPATFDDLDDILGRHEDLRLAFDVRHFCVNGIDVGQAFGRYRDRIENIHYRDDCGLSDEQLRDFLGQVVGSGYAGGLIVEDQALNDAEKSDKSQLIAGLDRIRRVSA